MMFNVHIPLQQNIHKRYFITKYKLFIKRNKLPGFSSSQKKNYNVGDLIWTSIQLMEDEPLWKHSWKLHYIWVKLIWKDRLLFPTLPINIMVTKSKFVSYVVKKKLILQNKPFNFVPTKSLTYVKGKKSSKFKLVFKLGTFLNTIELIKRRRKKTPKIYIFNHIRKKKKLNYTTLIDLMLKSVNVK